MKMKRIGPHLLDPPLNLLRIVLKRATQQTEIKIDFKQILLKSLQNCGKSWTHLSLIKVTCGSTQSEAERQSDARSVL